MLFRWLLTALLLFLSMGSALAADGSISGELTDTEGKPAAGATLRLASGGESKAIEATSDADGRFVFGSVPRGIYQLSASAPGFVEVLKTAQLAGGQTLVVDLQFTRLAARTRMPSR